MTATTTDRATLERLRDRWGEVWQDALLAWSPFVKLSRPRWCLDEADRRREKLSGSFAMIRLQDHAVVIGLDEVLAAGVEAFPTEVLAHEIGHHVYAPGDLVDNARLLARIRNALPSRESYAPMVANLYTDLLINDRLQRSSKLDMAGVYRALRPEEVDAVWALYMRTYEVLWRLDFGTLVPEPSVPESVAVDATLAARVVRVYAKNWLQGAGRFATLMLTYLLEQPAGPTSVAPWMDTLGAGAGDAAPDGMAEIEDDEFDGAIHPADDPAITGVDERWSEAEHPTKGATGRETVGGQKNRYRTPTEYVELMESLGVDVDPRDLVVRYYRERAIPHLVPFPVRESLEATDPLPEGLATWDIGSSLARVDWIQSVIRSPHVIPGLTTMERVYGTTQGADPERTPVDLYLGVDCSGSMSNPARTLSHPVLAGAVIVISALRVGSRVKVCLSGEPGEHSETGEFIRDEREALGVLTGYLGTGYAFGVGRLEETFLDPSAEFTRPVHILVVTDSDIFHMLGEVKNGWEIIRKAKEVAGGGATFVLDRTDQSFYADQLDRLEACGWDVHHVDAQQGLVTFAREFARRHYEAGDARRQASR